MRAGSGICETERKQKCAAILRRIQSLWNIDMTYQLMSDRNCERKQKCLKCYAEFSFCGCKVGLTQVTNPGRLSTSRMRFHNILLLLFNQLQIKKYIPLEIPTHRQIFATIQNLSGQSLQRGQRHCQVFHQNACSVLSVVIGNQRMMLAMCLMMAIIAMH